MTDQQHPITPPPELVKQWLSEHFGYGLSMYESSAMVTYTDITAKAAQWGADQELEACCEWLKAKEWIHPEFSDELRSARRPKPQTLNSIALQMLGTIERDAHYLPEITDTIRRALEQLDD